jgi:ATP-dependent Clp protease ATP-binding subunit ClpC
MGLSSISPQVVSPTLPMANTDSIPIFALVETFSTDLVTATLLPPLSLKVTTHSWPSAKRSLAGSLKKEIRKTKPVAWARPRPINTPEHLIVPFSIDPPRGDAAWSESISCDVDLFWWPLWDKHQQWWCPSLDSVFVAQTSEVDDDFLRTQIENMRTRKSDEWSLAMVLKTFVQRSFRIREVARLTNVEIADVYGNKSKSVKKSNIKTLKSVATRMNDWKQDAIFELDGWVSDLDDVLLSPKPRSLLLVGPTGVGKTAVALQWSRTHQERSVWATSGARLVSGATGFGMWQKRCQQMIRETKESKSILHLGSLVELVESGKINGQPGVASMLRGAIERNQLVAIAECTPEQLSIVEREDPVLLRSFCRLDVTPPDSARLQRILFRVGEQLGSSERVGSLFHRSAINELIRLHERFSTYAAMPGQPISMMRSMAESWQHDRSIIESDVVFRFAHDTGLPLFLLDDKIGLDIESVRNELAGQVIGQAEPVERLVELITMLKARLNRRDRPLASLLLIGPTGVGKTETAKALARLLYRDESRMIRIDMSEYAQPWSAIRMIGVGCEGNGTLTSPIRDQPFSVVLLDEFEKCHPSVLDLLLQVLGEGRLTDSAGRLSDFRNAVIILTSNLGVDTYQGRSFGFGNSPSEVHEHFTREVRRYVRPELLGRLDKLIPYGPLSIEVLRCIADRELAKIAKRPGIRHRSIPISITDQTREKVVSEGVDPVYGARPLRREIERQIVIPLADELASGKNVTRPKQDSSLSSDQPGFDSIRDLRYRAALLLRSEPYQANDNKIERMQRMIERLERDLTRSKSVRPNSHGQTQLENLRIEFRAATKVKGEVDAVVAEIEKLQRDVFDRWMRDNESPRSEQLQSSTRLNRQLRERLVEMQSVPTRRNSDVCLLILCNPIEVVVPLWKAYRKLTELNEWKPQLYRLSRYDPFLDSVSREYQERKAAARGGITIPKEREAAFHLLKRSENPLEKKKLIDVFHVDSWDDLLRATKPTQGIVLQFSTWEALNWLGEEEGVHHFVAKTEKGSGRRRARVAIHLGRLTDWNPPENWAEEPSLPTRDPRRTYHDSTRILHSHLINRDVVIDADNLEEGLFDMILKEGDNQLWSSIGYVPIPEETMIGYPLRPSMEVPY